MNLLVLLALVFAGVALMAVVSQRFSGSADPARMQQLQRWLLPLVGVMMVLSLLKHYL